MSNLRTLIAALPDTDEGNALVRSLAEKLADAEYGAPETHEVPGTPFAFRLTVTVDDTYSVNDYDADGRIEWTSGRNTGERYAPRPSDFDGAARIIRKDGDHALWWQPPGVEITGKPWDAETLRTEGDRVADLVEYGFKLLHVEVLEILSDSLDAEHAVSLHSEYLGGCDSVDAYTVSDMIDEAIRTLVNETSK